MRAARRFRQVRATIRSRKMTRDFSRDPLSPELVMELLDIARHAPSAGNTQGVQFVLLSGDRVAEFWDATLPSEKRPDFAWPGLLLAPVIVIPLSDAASYLARYREADKAHTQLGQTAESWQVPYWHTDCAFAVQNLLLLAHSRGLGALFFGLFDNTRAVCELLGLPEDVVPIGAVALGHSQSQATSRSARRPRPKLDEVVHLDRWQG